MSQKLFSIIDEAWENRELLKDQKTKDAIFEIKDIIKNRNNQR